MEHTPTQMKLARQKFIVAKFTSDVRRAEPRNIGVILWTPKRVGFRFLDPGDVRFVHDKAMYERWVNFWSTSCQAKTIEAERGREVSLRSPEFIDALLDTQRGQYRLVESGFVAEKLLVKDVKMMTDRLFVDLVAPKPKKEEPDETSGKLVDRCEEMFLKIGLTNREDFHARGKVQCPVGRAKRDFPVSYLLGTPSHPTVIFQRVDIGEARSVDSTSFMFERLLEAKIVTRKEQLAALYSDTSSDGAMVDQLGEYSTPINLSDSDAGRRLKAIVG